MAKSNRLKFSLRFLIVLVALFTIPCIWVSSNISQYQEEIKAVKSLRALSLDMMIAYESKFPRWLSLFIPDPGWMERVTEIEVRGWIQGEGLNTFVGDDTTLAAMHKDLLVFENLEKLSFEFVLVTDESLPLIRELTNVESIEFYVAKMTPAAVKKLDAELPNAKINMKVTIKDPNIEFVPNTVMNLRN